MVGRMQPRVVVENSPVDHYEPYGDDEVQQRRSCLAFRFPGRGPRSVGSGEERHRRLVKQQHEPSPQDDVALLRDTERRYTQRPIGNQHHTPVVRQESPSPLHPSPAGYASPVEALLVPPTPTDRNPRTFHQRQRMAAQEAAMNDQETPNTLGRRRPRGLYEGEIEPVGTRGMEAPILPGPDGDNVKQKLSLSTFQPSVVTRVVSPTESSVSSGHSHRGNTAPFQSLHGVYGFPPAPSGDEESTEGIGISQNRMTSRPPRRSARKARNLQPTLPAVSERAPLQFSPETGKAVRWTGGDVSTSAVSVDRMWSDAESTTSDDDIARMLPDLLPSMSESSTGAPLHSLSPAIVSPDGPSRAAQQAAAVAKSMEPPISIASTRSMTPSEASQQPLPPSTRSSTPPILHPDELEALNARAMEHVHNGNFDRALTAFTQVLTYHRRLHGPAHPTVASSHHNLGTVHAKRAAVLVDDSAAQRHCRSLALESFQAAARAARDSLGRNHPNVAVSLVRIGFLLLQSRQYSNAIVTFQEALRIRQAAASGPIQPEQDSREVQQEKQQQQGLIANLYNNLGVCHMHLGEFQKGRNQLHQALAIQRSVCETDETLPVDLDQTEEDDDDRWVHLLELADTLFNVGGLNLEWIRRHGPDTRQTEEAVSVLQETCEIRSKVLGSEDGSVKQVQVLLEMARSIPVPKVPMSNSRWSGGCVHNDHREHVISPSSSRGVTPVEQHHSPRDAAGTVVTPTSANHSIDSRLQEAAQQNRISPGNARRSVDPPQQSGGRRSRSATPESLSRGVLSPPASKASELYSNPLHEKDEWKGRQQKQHGLSSSPKDITNGEKRRHIEPLSSQQIKPIPEATDSSDNRDKRIIIEPHLVPNISPNRRRGLNISDEAVGHSMTGELTVDTSAEVVTKKNSYDAEENCLLNTSGVDSTHGRVHYPWQASGGPDIVVARPYRQQEKDSNSEGMLGQPQSDDPFISTGNAERDDLIHRARAILAQHAEDRQNNNTSNRSMDHDLVEDGVAPLGGEWDAYPTKSVHSMLQDPMNHLPDIHEEASRMLSVRMNVETYAFCLLYALSSHSLPISRTITL